MDGLDLAGLDPAGPEARHCEHPGCAENGEFRAPKSRDNLGNHYWFCLAHVREYNSAWDYFVGMTQEEIERYQREDVTWHRPTWRLGARAADAATSPPRDNFGFFGARESGRHERGAGAAEPSTPVRNALAVLNLETSATPDEVRTRYKELVKRFHPDLNGGSKDAEERLKVINQAYAHLAARGPTGP